MNIKYVICSFLISYLFILCPFSEAQNKIEDVPIFAFSDSTATYNHLVNPNSANEGEKWDSPEYRVPIGFEFSYAGRKYDTIIVSDYLQFTSDDYIQTFYSDLADRGEDSSISPISYLTSGAAGSQVFKLEYRNAGFYCEYSQAGTRDFFCNFQIWLYEGSNLIEMHIGPNEIGDEYDAYCKTDGAFYGLTYNDASGSHQDFHFLNGTVDSIVEANNNFTRLTGTPEEGTVYRFEALPIGIKKIDNQRFAELLSFPNPSNGSFTIEFPYINKSKGNISIIDFQGKIVEELFIRAGVKTFQIPDSVQLPSGIYFLDFNNNDQKRATGRIVIH